MAGPDLDAPADGALWRQRTDGLMCREIRAVFAMRWTTR
jgi:hypothetical protein